MTPNKTIIWMLQANQTTPVIKDFFKTLRTRVEKHINLMFWVPDTSIEDLEKLKDLNPMVYKTTTRTATASPKVYQAKRNALRQESFCQDLLISDTLLLDDLAGGNTQMTTLEIDPPTNTCGMILQVPSPLGSSETEEKIFHATLLWTRTHHIPAIGYELLPLDTKWTLAASLPDGIVTRYPESHKYLKANLPHNNIWQLPTYESVIFSSAATNFHLNGVKASYHYRNHHAIAADKTVLYLPHNVAMMYEYKKLIQMLIPIGRRLHLMFSVGKDQNRGQYSHVEMIQMICKEELGQVASHSFHDANSSWEMMMADAIVACSAGLNTMVGEKDLPCIVYDPIIPEMSRGNKRRVNTKKALLSAVQEQIDRHNDKIELADIMMLLSQAKNTNV